MTAAAETTPTPHPDVRPTHWLSTRPRLIVASALMLFLELALIRWTGSNIVHLGYFTNFVLLGSFLGIGLGFPRVARTDPAALLLPDRAGRPGAARPALPGHRRPRQADGSSTSQPEHQRAAAVADPARHLRGAGDRAGWARPSWSGAASPSCPARGVPLRPDRQPASGIAAFTALSLPRRAARRCGARSPRSLSPCCSWPRAVRALGGAVAGAVADRRRARSRGDARPPGRLWSPYYKVTTRATTVDGVPLIRTSTSTASRTRQATRPEQAGRGAAVRAAVRARSASGTLDNVLIVGAGTGTDVAIALSQGRQARRRRRDRPAAARRSARSCNPDQPVPRPAGHRPHQRRPRLPRAHRQEVRPDPLRAARLAHPGRRGELAAAGELPVHRAGDARRPRTTSRPAAPSRCTTTTARTGWSDRLGAHRGRRRSATSRASTSSAGRPQAVITAGLTAGRPALRRRRGRARTGRHRRRRPVTTARSSTCKDRTIPRIYLITLGLILRRQPARGPRRRRAVPADAPVRRPVPARARRSCCWRPRASPGSRCCSAPPGSSTRSCSPGCWSPCSPRWR